MPDSERRTHRIGVANLDAVEQARTWLALGAPEATKTLVGALRTALLLADTVVLDRNQVFEGVFFVAMSPDRLAWHLGLPPGAPLPLTVGLLNPVEGSLWPRPDAPWLTSAGATWGIEEPLAEQVDRNYLAVPGDRQRVSSPMIALTGLYDGQAADGGPSVNAPEPSKRWHREADPAFIPPHVWAHHRDAVLAGETIRRGRLAWLEAMKTARVGVEEWAQRPLRIGPALERSLPFDSGARALALDLMAVEEVDGHTEACSVAHDGLAPRGDGLCGRRHVGKRSLVVRWLDGHDVPQLSPSRIGEAWRHASYVDREAAFRWWNGAYYDAICERDRLRMLNLHNISNAEGSDAAVEVAWGLRRPEPGRLERVRERLSTRTADRDGDLAIEGEVVRHLVELGPWRFASLRDRQVVDREKVWDRPRNRDMFELALAVRDAAEEHTSRVARIFIAGIRLVALGLLAAAFAFKDAGYLPESGGLMVTTWIVLGIVAAFPWDAVSSLLRMSPGGLESTLRIRE